MLILKRVGEAQFIGILENLPSGYARMAEGFRVGFRAVVAYLNIILERQSCL
jgi:hypothetical protein